MKKLSEAGGKSGKERYNWPVTILLIIGVLLLIVLPLYMTVMIAIKDPSDMGNVLALPKKLRLQNFVDAWNLTDFPRKFFNTAFITVVNLFFTLITNSFVAYAITRNRKKSKFFNFMYYYLISAMFIPFSVIMLPLVLLSDAKQQTLQLAQYVFKSQFSVDYNLAFASYLLVLAPVLLVYLICQKWIMNGVVAGAVK